MAYEAFGRRAHVIVACNSLRFVMCIECGIVDNLLLLGEIVTVNHDNVYIRCVWVLVLFVNKLIDVSTLHTYITILFLIDLSEA